MVVSTKIGKNHHFFIPCKNFLIKPILNFWFFFWFFWGGGDFVFFKFVYSGILRGIHRFWVISKKLIQNRKCWGSLTPKFSTSPSRSKTWIWHYWTCTSDIAFATLSPSPLIRKIYQKFSFYNNRLILRKFTSLLKFPQKFYFSSYLKFISNFLNNL